jgi:hypothetical protein
MANRILECADRYVERIKTQTAMGTGLSGQPIGQALIKLEQSLALESWEHAQYQQQQARAHASGKLTTEEAQTIYIALGEAMSTKNGGWKSHVKLPLKIAITQTMEELVRAALAK